MLYKSYYGKRNKLRPLADQYEDRDIKLLELTKGRVGVGANSKHWFTTSFLGCRKAMLGVWVGVQMKWVHIRINARVRMLGRLGSIGAFSLRTRQHARGPVKKLSSLFTVKTGL